VLPPSLPPRGLSRVQAAAYIGISTTLFDEMVKDERMPKPKRINGRVVWDRLELDLAFAGLSVDDPESWGTPQLKPYKYTRCYRDRERKLRWFYRRIGKQTPMPFEPGTAGFQATYDSLNGRPPSLTAVPTTAHTLKAGTYRWLCVPYFSSMVFEQLDSGTRGERVRGTVVMISSDHTGHTERTADKCPAVALLRGEVARANETAIIDREVVRRRTEVRELREQSGSLAADPLVIFFGRGQREDCSAGVTSALPSRFFCASRRNRRSRRRAGDPRLGRGRHELAAGCCSRIIPPERADHSLAHGADGTEGGRHRCARARIARAGWCGVDGVNARAPEKFVAELDRVRQIPELTSKINNIGAHYYGTAVIQGVACT
jgi:predicted DNA-binding transcriptional regulator AlpA